MADSLIRALALEGRARAFAAVTTDAIERLRQIHDPSPTVTAALGRAATGALLLAAFLEKVTAREPVLTLEVAGGGPVGRLVATASPSGWVRALATNPDASAEPRPDGRPNVAAVVGTNGHLVVTRDPGIGEPYRGVVPLSTGEIANDIAHYLTDSEQSPAAVVLGVAIGPDGRLVHAGGYVVHLLPGVSDAEAEELTGRVRQLGPVTALLVKGHDPRSWLERLFPDGVELLDEVPVRFHCGCSQKRVEQALTLLGGPTIEALLVTGEKSTELVCEFCRHPYRMSRDDLARLLLELSFPPGTDDGPTN